MNAIAGLGPKDFASGLQSLLPPGDALTHDPNAVLTSLLAGMSGRMAAVHAQVGVLTEVESDPRQTTILLTDWEKSFGLPDPCLGAAPTYAERRAQLVARIAARGGQSSAYMISYAATLGFPITITTFKPFRFGMAFGLPIYGIPWAFTWQINAPTLNYQYFDFGANNFGEPFAVYSNVVLQCEMKRIAPAHTVLLFQYGNVVGDFTFDFSQYKNSQYIVAF